MTAYRIKWLALAATAAISGCTGLVGDNGEQAVNDSVAKSLCVVDTPLRRLTRFEYNNTVRDLLGDTTRPADVLPPEEEVAGFDNQAAALTSSDLLIEQYMKVAEDVSARAVGNLSGLLAGCDPALDGADVCALSFIESFAKRAFRRPVSQSEVQRFRALFDWAMTDPDLGRFEDGIEVVIEAALQSPSFLYRPELGAETPLEGDVVPFTSWEMATKLSYMLWNTMPDAELFAAAEADALRSKEQIAAQASRMLEDDKARDLIRNFHTQWLLLTHIDSVSKDTSTYPSYRPALNSLWKEEIQTFTEHVILEGEGSLETLLTASYTFVNEDLASFYGDDVLETVAGPELRRVDVDPNRRAGFLTSAGLMATQANANQSSPVFRGKFVREQLMCDTLPPPPNDLVIEPPQLDPTKTTKEQFEEIGANAACAGCHNLMNPIGFIFEHYDGIGQWRDQQNGKAIDATGEVIQTDDVDGFYDGAVELAEALANSTQVQECVASQWFRFAYNRTVTADDTCSIDQLNQAFADSGFNIKQLLVALTQTNAFLYRRAVPQEPETTGGAL
ncbi:MAG: hypothetical protein AMJ62_10105 [Myxococcales bacterium SG8_38]|nr:MAG: hypothetical protein AMJ62_10105 [Myxococcales bacterium SG8_38]